MEDCEVLLAESAVCVCVLSQVLQGTDLASQNKMNFEGAEGRPGGLKVQCLTFNGASGQR